MKKETEKKLKVNSEPEDYNLETIFRISKDIKPKYHLTAEQMDELCENRILRKIHNPTPPPHLLLS